MSAGSTDRFTGSAGGASPPSAAAASRKPRSSHADIIWLSGQTRCGWRVETKDALPAPVVFHQLHRTARTSSLPLFKVCRCIKKAQFGAGFVTTKLLFLALPSGPRGPTICFSLAPGRAGRAEPRGRQLPRARAAGSITPRSAPRQGLSNVGDPFPPPASMRSAGQKNPEGEQPAGHMCVL